VRVAAPLAVSDEAVRLAVIGKLGWIKRQRARFEDQPRQSKREMVSGESHYFLGQLRWPLPATWHGLPAPIHRGPAREGSWPGPVPMPLIGMAMRRFWLRHADSGGARFSSLSRGPHSPESLSAVGAGRMKDFVGTKGRRRAHAQRERVMLAWYRRHLKALIPPPIEL